MNFASSIVQNPQQAPAPGEFVTHPARCVIPHGASTAFRWTNATWNNCPDLSSQRFLLIHRLLHIGDAPVGYDLAVLVRREFVKNNYTLFKALNPGLPIYVRPADGVEPHIAARYGTCLPQFFERTLCKLTR